MNFFSRKKILSIGLVITALIIISAFFWYTPKPLQPKANVYADFAIEAYDKILENYWMTKEDLGDKKLSELFELSIQKAGNTVATTQSKNREGVRALFIKVLDEKKDDLAKKQFILDSVNQVLNSLLPIGRNGLFSEKQEIALRQNVSNINPSKDLYKILGLEKGASEKEIEAAFKQKDLEIADATSTEAKMKREEIAYARKVLINTDSKNLYDTNQIEPTIFSRSTEQTLYLHIEKISPTTLQEFGNAIVSASTSPNIKNMILDLRGNIGGSLDFLPAFLGIFIGPNQYAFDLFHQGDYNVQRTTLGKFEGLKQFKEIAILTDGATQSTAELTAQTFRHFNLAHIVGLPTRGWGTIENTYPLQTVIDSSEKYSLFLVNNITLRDEDNQPIEGRGVNPDVNILDKNWKNDIKKLFNSESLIQEIIDVESKPPRK